MPGDDEEDDDEDVTSSSAGPSTPPRSPGHQPSVSSFFIDGEEDEEPAPAYEYEVFKMTQPGLSAFPREPTRAAESLDVLLDEAVRVVPEELRKCTPVAVKATAGLRRLGTQEAADILHAVRRRLEEHYPFSLQGGADAVQIMDGRDEGVYAWLTANYLLKTLGGAPTPGNGSMYE